ncbi:GntR family transcriptional regulator [Rhizobium alvei]|uniref:GntR family transcriptional regulator n=1 Tax=Rhizobium alvei TaxID=1132659 RepID=A0ABT8YGT0_9HYPH|nr:GntR family transcriptional regulator [Rhizobium alvei]MDO6962884.1 GntR family transcriptional regulator [Rhizobium alvei]
MTEDTMHKSRTERTYNLLRDAIVHAHYAPGEKLRIDHIAKTMEASLGAVREALSRLTAEGLVVAEPQKGFVVAPISRQDLLDMTEVRIEIECRCLEDTIRRADLEWEGRIIALQHRLKVLAGRSMADGGLFSDQWHMAHTLFHDELTASCGNMWWLRLRRQLFTQSERYRRLSGPLDETGRDVTAEHDAIAAAAIARDIDTARTAMAEHLRRTTTILLQSSLPFEDKPIPVDA